MGEEGGIYCRLVGREGIKNLEVNAQTADPNRSCTPYE